MLVSPSLASYHDSPVPSLPTHHNSQYKPQFLQILIPKPKKFPTISCSQSQYQSPIPTFSGQEPNGTETHQFTTGIAPPVLKKRKRYRKEYPGENKGITEEMRFVAMKLRNHKVSPNSGPSDDDDATWEPSVEGFVKYLVDCKLVFEMIERVVEDSNDVSYAYFRKTGLERSESLTRDLEWFAQQNIMIPEPSNHGISYATYLKELGEKSAPLFLSHFYNMHFSHVTGGEVIAKQVAEKLMQGKELEFFRWEGEAEELLKGVREKLNRLSEHWSRDDKNKCLREATKSFKNMGQIVRLIIL